MKIFLSICSMVLVAQQQRQPGCLMRDGKPASKKTRTCVGFESEQVNLLAGFIQSKPAISIKDKSGEMVGSKKSLHQAVRDKDWHMIAYNYNGPNYERDGYHTKLEAAYQQYRNASK
jgi:hypothetical protein